MKITKIYALALATISASFTANAQQLPNSGFEDEWVKCMPYTFYMDEASAGQLSQVVVGENPTGWTISNVAGMASSDGGEGKPVGIGSTMVGAKVAGYESANAVQLTNSANPIMDVQIVPAYITLGTTWSTANPSFVGGYTINNSDGGTFGGISFNGRPTGLEFMYKRARGTEKPDEFSTVVAYMWKGHWTQKDVPVTIYMAGDPKKVDMIDRDRCVLGIDMEGCQGGEVTKTDDAELIAMLKGTITEVSDDWVKFSADFEYFSDATPEMLNIVIASGDYFGGADVVGKENSLTVDNVKLIYAEEPSEYNGSITIDMGTGASDPLTNQKVLITANSDDKCTFRLKDFNLTGDYNSGDIVVDDVTYTKDAEGNITYSGSTTGLTLMVRLDPNAEPMQICADVDVKGTEDTSHNLTMIIKVKWLYLSPDDHDNVIPIDVTFNGKRANSAGIEDIVVDTNVAPRYFLINGVEVSEAPTSGLYIELRGNKARKVLVK